MKVPSPTTNRTLPSAQPLIGPSGQGATPDAFGAGVGQSVAGVGKSLLVLGQYVQQQQDQKARFDATRKFSDFQNRVTEKIAESKRTADPALANFHEVVTAEYQNAAADFINNEIPPDLRDEFAARTAQLGESVFSDSLSFQYQATDAYFKRGISDSYEAARVNLSQNPSLENLEAARAGLDEMIDSTGLNEAEKVAMRRTAYTGLESIVYKAEQVRRIMDEAAGAEGGSAQRQAQELLSLNSGGTEEEIAAAAVQGEQLAVQSVGSIDLWAALPARARAALISVAAENGGLPDNVVAAVQTGDLENIAQAVRDLSGDAESPAANLVLDPGATTDDDPRLANVPYEDRLSIIEDAKRQAASALDAEAKAAKAQNASMVNSLMTSIYDGKAGQLDIDKAREGGWLTDIDDIVKAQKLLDDKTEALLQSQMMGQYISSERTLNPDDADHKKMFNAYIGQEGLNALNDKSEVYAATVLLPAVRSVQDIPTDVAGSLEGMIRSNDLSKAKWALDLMTQLQQAAPKAYANRFSEKDQRDAEFWRARKDYYPEDVIMPMVRGGTTQAERAATEQLRVQAAKTYTDKKVADGLLSAIVPWGFSHNEVQYSVPWAAQALEGEFQALFTDEFSRDGDVERAKTAAINSLKKVWGVTQIGGKPNLMKYPPEQVGYMPINGSYDWMKEQARADAGLAPDENFELLSDEQTREEYELSRAGGQAPSYLMIKVDANGVGRMMFDEAGAPIRVGFEVTPEMAAAQEEEFINKRRDLGIADATRTLDNATAHSLETAWPIPPDVAQSINDSFGFSNDQSPESVDGPQAQALQEFLFGKPDQAVGIQTNKYRLP